MIKKTKAICESENKDFNPQTEKCVKRCKQGEERNNMFKCKQTRKTKAICEDVNKDYNPQTRRCVKRCKHGEERNDNFKCKQTRKTKAICEDVNKDFNPQTERCVKRCKHGEERNDMFKCKKVKIPNSSVKSPAINKKDATDLLKLISVLEQTGSKYTKTGLYYKPSDVLGLIMYEYLIKKYNVNCFMYGVRYTDAYTVLTIDFTKYGLLANDKYLKEYQAYVYKMIKLIMNCIMKIQSTDQEILIIPLTIYGNYGAHANMLIYRKTLNVLEHYEPHGKKIIISSNVNQDINTIMNLIVNKMNVRNNTSGSKYYNGNITYITPENICPHGSGFQKIENDLILPKKITKIERGGLCMVWSIFFAELTLVNPHLSSREIFDNVFNCFNNKDCVENSQKARDVIRGYLDIMYNAINPIIQRIVGLDINEVLDANGKLDQTIAGKITKLISTKKFITEHEKTLKKNFEKYHDVDISKYFKEPDTVDFKSLSPSKLDIGMLDTS